MEREKQKITEKYENLKNNILKADLILEESNKILHERIVEGIKANKKEVVHKTNSFKPTKKMSEQKS